MIFYQNETVLGIDPGARQFGWAVFRGGDLRHCGVKTIKRGTPHATIELLEDRLRDLIEMHRPNTVALEIPESTNQTQSFVAVVVSKIPRLVKREFGESIHCRQFYPSEIRRTLCRGIRPTKRNVSVMLADLFPELRRRLNLPNERQTKYHGMAFDAVAVAYYCAKGYGRPLDYSQLRHGDRLSK